MADRVGYLTDEQFKAEIGLDKVDNTPDTSKSVATADKLTTARTLSASGDVAWSGTFDGSADFSVTSTIASHAVTFGKFVAATQKCLIGANAAGNFQEVTLGTGLSLTSGVLSATGTGGTVTSVTASSPLASSGGTTPNITITGSALTKTDDTNVTLTLGGTPSTALLAAASITVGWTGTLGVTRGGTGLGSCTLGDLRYASASNTLSNLAGNITSTKKFLTQTGTGTVSAAPAWGTIAAGDIPTLNQNTTGSAATLTTSRNIDGQAFNGSADITVIAPGTHAATSKTTPVDADELPLVDSATSNVLKKLTWANLKATAKTYFDTLYQPLAATLTSWASVTRATGFDTFTSTPSSANLASLITDETGSGLLVFGTTPTLATPVINGLPTGTGVAATSTASVLVARDANKNILANNFLADYTTTVTAAGTTTLTVSSTYLQFFTGTTTQTVTLPVASTLALGQQFQIVNNSTGAVTVNSSGGNAVIVIVGGASATLTCILTSGTTAASWSVSYWGVSTASGKLLTASNSLTLTGTDGSSVAFGSGGTVLYNGGALGTPSSGTLTNCTFPTLNQNTTGSAAKLTTARTIAGNSFDGTANISINDTDLSGSAWTSYTPTITAATGTITTASATGRYKQIGKTVYVQMTITVTTNGTGSQAVWGTLPVNASTNGEYMLMGRSPTTGKMLQGDVASGSNNKAFIVNYDNTYPAANGTVLALTGCYEAA